MGALKLLRGSRDAEYDEKQRGECANHHRRLGGGVATVLAPCFELVKVLVGAAAQLTSRPTVAWCAKAVAISARGGASETWTPISVGLAEPGFGRRRRVAPVTQRQIEAFDRAVGTTANPGNCAACGALAGWGVDVWFVIALGAQSTLPCSTR